MQTLQECKIKYTEVQQNNPHRKSIKQKIKKMLILRKWKVECVCVFVCTPTLTYFVDLGVKLQIIEQSINK